MTPTTTPNPTTRPRPLGRALGWGATLSLIAGVCGGYVLWNRPHPQRAAAVPIVSFDTAADQMRQQQQHAADAERGHPARQTAAQTTIATAAAPMSEETRLHALGRLARVDRLIRDYAGRMGEFPVGSNADITRALRGQNPKKVIFVTPDEMPISDKNELTDPWQTPYFFHQLSGREMEIFSAGPDRQMWTADDMKVTAR